MKQSFLWLLVTAALARKLSKLGEEAVHGAEQALHEQSAAMKSTQAAFSQRDQSAVSARVQQLSDAMNKFTDMVAKAQMAFNGTKEQMAVDRQAMLAQLTAEHAARAEEWKALMAEIRDIKAQKGQEEKALMAEIRDVKAQKGQEEKALMAEIRDVKAQKGQEEKALMAEIRDVKAQKGQEEKALMAEIRDVKAQKGQEEKEFIAEIKEERASRAKDRRDKEVLMTELKEEKAARQREDDGKKELESEIQAEKAARAQEEQQLEHVTQMLGSLGSLPITRGEPEAKVPKKASFSESFPLCRGPQAFLEEAQETAITARRQTSACSDSEIKLTATQSSTDTPFESTCCAVHEEYCAGCAVPDAAQTGCKTCMGGFTLTAGVCVACMDFPHWVDSASQNCYKTSCSDEPFQGISSNQACCSCGGGHREATKFSYYVGPMALGMSSVVGHPVPRTAKKYSLNKDCELIKYGLSLDPETGTLKLADGCGTLGCWESPVEVDCMVTAHEGPGLSASAHISLKVGVINYGPNPVVLLDGMNRVPAVQSAAKSDGSPFKVACAPETSWIQIDETSGALSLNSPSSVSSVTDKEGKYLGKGATCTVHKGLSRTDVVVIAPVPWTSMSYSYGGTHHLYVSVGEKTPVFQVKGQGDSYASAPTRFSARCWSEVWPQAAFAFDTITGLATFEGHEVFRLDVMTGALQFTPAESLTKTMDSVKLLSKDQVRREINMTCNVYGYYEWTPSGQDAVLVHSIKDISIRDDTCWSYRVSRFHSYAQIMLQGARSDESYRAECFARCRQDPFCSHLAFTHTHSNKKICISAIGACSNATDPACKYTWPAWVRYTGCGERHSCIHLNAVNFHYLSGQYCYKGENAARESMGIVYFKRGLTTEESFWLMRADPMRHPFCSAADWVVLQPSTGKDRCC